MWVRPISHLLRRVLFTLITIYTEHCLCAIFFVPLSLIRTNYVPYNDKACKWDLRFSVRFSFCEYEDSYWNGFIGCCWYQWHKIHHVTSFSNFTQAFSQCHLLAFHIVPLIWCIFFASPLFTPFYHCTSQDIFWDIH